MSGELTATSDCPACAEGEHSRCSALRFADGAQCALPEGHGEDHAFLTFPFHARTGIWSDPHAPGAKLDAETDSGLDLTPEAKAIQQACDEIKATLVAKNSAYGNSVLDPLRIFSKADRLEQLNVRIDDKLSRFARGAEYDGDDTELDLIGYLILRRTVRKALHREAKK